MSKCAICGSKKSRYIKKRESSFINSSIVYNFFDKKSKVGGANNEVKQNEQLAEELHKTIIKTF